MFWRTKSYRPEGPCALACTALGYAALNLRKKLYVTKISELYEEIPKTAPLTKEEEEELMLVSEQAIRASLELADRMEAA